MTTETIEKGEEEKVEDSFPAQSYGLVHEQYAKVQSAIEQFEDSTSTLLDSQTSCFLAASKSHLQDKIMPVIKSLQETVEAKERAIATDERLEALSGGARLVQKGGPAFRQDSGEAAARKEGNAGEDSRSRARQALDGKAAQIVGEAKEGRRQ